MCIFTLLDDAKLFPKGCTNSHPQNISFPCCPSSTLGIVRVNKNYFLFTESKETILCPIPFYRVLQKTEGHSESESIL